MKEAGMMDEVFAQEGETLRVAERAATELTQTSAAFDRLRAAMVEELLASAVGNAAVREKLYLGVQVLDGVRRALQEAVSAGEVANYRVLLAEQGLLR
jgi:hypothetical protein